MSANDRARMAKPTATKFCMWAHRTFSKEGQPEDIPAALLGSSAADSALMRVTTHSRSSTSTSRCDSKTCTTDGATRTPMIPNDLWLASTSTSLSHATDTHHSCIWCIWQHTGSQSILHFTDTVSTIFWWHILVELCKLLVMYKRQWKDEQWPLTIGLSLVYPHGTLTAVQNAKCSYRGPVSDFLLAH